MAIQDGSFFENKVLKDACAHAKETGGAINFAGLLTKANVHASLDHLKALIKMAEQEKVPKINLHLFADAKDSPPHTRRKISEGSAAGISCEFDGTILRDGSPGELAGDRDGISDDDGLISAPWLPTRRRLSKKIMHGDRRKSIFRRCVLTDDKKIEDGDSLLFFNYREDSIRQLASAFIVKPFDKFATLDFKNLYVATMSHYDDSSTVPVAFPADTVNDPFGKVVSDRGLLQLRLAETYKYAHVTYFFNGLREAPFPNEYRTLVPSYESLHPEEHPEMMAKPITDRLVEAITNHTFDFILVNYANPDTIAHTADYNASLEAVRVIDREIGRVLKAAQDTDALLVITSDHGISKK